jgi:hypothetical protein
LAIGIEGDVVKRRHKRRSEAKKLDLVMKR